MRYIITGVAILLLAACDHTWVTPEHINKATELCSPNGGIQAISWANTSNWDKNHALHVACNNGATFKHKWRTRAELAPNPSTMP